MIQTVPSWRLHSRVMYSVELNDNFVVKTKPSLDPLIYLYVTGTLTIFWWLSFKLRPLATTQMLSTEHGKIHGSESHIWSISVRPKPLRTMINFGSFTQRNAPDNWSDDPFADHSKSVIRWIHDQSGFDWSLTWKGICSKGTPQIRNPDPDPSKGTHP